MTARRHALVFAERVPLHEGTMSRYYVTDCRCGWQSPLCKDADRARALYAAHKATRRNTPRGPTTEQLRARALAQSGIPPTHDCAVEGCEAVRFALPRPCLACNREQGERMCDLCQRLEVAEAGAS